MPLAGGRPYRVCTRGPEARVAAWDRDGTPPGCRALSSLRHLVWLIILGSSIPYQMLPCLPAGCGPEREHAQRGWPVVTPAVSADVWEGDKASVGSLGWALKWFRYLGLSTACLWRSEHGLVESVLSFYPVGSGNQTRVIRLAEKALLFP